MNSCIYFDWLTFQRIRFSSSLLLQKENNQYAVVNNHNLSMINSFLLHTFKWEKSQFFWINWLISLNIKMMIYICVKCPCLINRSFSPSFFYYILEQSMKMIFLVLQIIQAVMNHLRNLDPRRRSSDQKMHQTTSVSTFHLNINKIFLLYFRQLQLIILL